VERRKDGERFFDDPVDLDTRERRGDVGCNRKVVHHVAQRRGFDEQYARHESVAMYML
jgi:hypothetical protein